jgi:hypothetical protein
MKKKIDRCLGLLAAIMLSGLTVFAQGKVDFSGKWKINESKSKFNEQYSSHPESVTITQSGNNMTVERVSSMQGQSMTFTDQYTLDGKECKNAGFRNTESISTANWADDGKSLIIKSKVPMDNGDMTMDRKIRMDGDNLILDFTAKGPWGESAETWVFDKQ